MKNMDAETKQEIYDTGRDIAQTMLRSAFSDSGSSEETAHNLLGLQVMAAHVFATCAYNAKVQNGDNADEFLKAICEGIKKEFLYVEYEAKNGNMDFVTVDRPWPRNTDKKH